MAYEIPQNLKYQEKIAFGLTFPQLLWLSVFGCIAGTVFLKTNLDFSIKITIALALCGIGAGFAFFDFTEKISAFRVFQKSIRGAGYFDPKIKSFVDVAKIEFETIFLKSGGLRAIVQVQPLNFGMLSSQEQEAIIKAYKDFLNSLDFSVQIVMRTVNLSLDNYLLNLEEKAKQSKNERLLEQFVSFKEFVKQFIHDNAVKNRLFYLVIPYSAANNTNPLKDLLIVLSNLFSKEKQETSFEFNRENALNHLNIRVKLCRDKLKKCNLLTKRLDTEELVSLLASFFEGFVEAKNNYFFPITLIEEFEKQQTKSSAYVGLNGEKRAVKCAVASFDF